jgi:hypothetical protein
MEEEGKVVREESLFPFKIPSNFHSCAINLSTFSKEHYSLYFMTRNLTRNYINEFRENTLSEEEFLICMKNLWNRETDMLFGGVRLKVKISHLEPTFSYLIVKYSWFAPCPKPFSRLQRNFYIFFPSVWISVVVFLFVVSVVSWCLAKQSNDIRSYANM